MSLTIFAKIAEERIRRAAEEGHLSDIPGMGQPLQFEDDSRVPEDLRMAYKILKNSGYTPEEVSLRREISRTEDLLADAPDEQTRYKALKRLNYLAMKLDTLRPQSRLLEETRYAHKIVDRLAGNKDGER